ncbi:hypothetical protein OGAPHI_005194 [Ogataea philodendri]|uniref:Cyclin-domain-containing protein n=1 Tax=Ogataea philodendri TaxID=1378263 RepID=A0A9P8P2G8_9ASCO|nr:uncharacterized protein OGAPHI_005194 [Ogataea philodendri]KAH3663791.1 hypothetical protein OGAPHI_005194 [Ogataea philodendri]
MLNNYNNPTPQPIEQYADQAQGQNPLPQEVQASSYTSITSPSNFVSYNSPSANPPQTFVHRNSFSSRSNSTDGSIKSLHQGSIGSISGLPQSSFLASSSSHIAPAGRRSLLTTKLQQQQTQSSPSAQQFASYVPPSHISSSYHDKFGSAPLHMPQMGSYSGPMATQFGSLGQQGLPPHPAPATATTTISKDIAFSTNSSSSTLYQDAQQSFTTPTYESHRPHFISASAPSQSFIQSSSFPRGSVEPQHNQFQPAVPHAQFSSSSLSRHPEPVTLASLPQTGPPGDHLDIVNHQVNDLLLMLSALLQKIVEANDSLHPDHYNSQGPQVPPTTEQNKYTANVLAFHGRNIPAISLHAYLTRISKYCPVTNEVFLSLLVYFDRIAKRANNGDFNSTFNSSPKADPADPNAKQQQLFVMDSYNIHRLIISGITVASKFFSDVFYKNSRYAKVGGLPLEELNHLELQFLLLLDFKLMIQVEEMHRYGDLLMKFWKREQSKVAQLSEH